MKKKKRVSHIAAAVAVLFFSGWVMADEHGGEPVGEKGKTEEHGGKPVEHAGKEMKEGATLDGKTFAGELGKKGKTTGDKDNFVFKNGKFRSTACDRYGFGEGVYSLVTKGDLISFEAKTESPTDGKMEWKGTVKGDTIDGIAKWSPPGKSPEEYWFKGTLKK